MRADAKRTASASAQPPRRPRLRVTPCLRVTPAPASPGTLHELRDLHVLVHAPAPPRARRSSALRALAAGDEARRRVDLAALPCTPHHPRSSRRAPPRTNTVSSPPPDALVQVRTSRVRPARHIHRAYTHTPHHPAHNAIKEKEIRKRRTSDASPSSARALSSSRGGTTGRWKTGAVCGGKRLWKESVRCDTKERKKRKGMARKEWERRSRTRKEPNVGREVRWRGRREGAGGDGGRGGRASAREDGDEKGKKGREGVMKRQTECGARTRRYGGGKTRMGCGGEGRTAFVDASQTEPDADAEDNECNEISGTGIGRRRRDGDRAAQGADDVKGEEDVHGEGDEGEEENNKNKIDGGKDAPNTKFSPTFAGMTASRSGANARSMPCRESEGRRMGRMRTWYGQQASCSLKLVIAQSPRPQVPPVTQRRGLDVKVPVEQDGLLAGVRADAAEDRVREGQGLPVHDVRAELDELVVTPRPAAARRATRASGDGRDRDGFGEPRNEGGVRIDIAQQLGGGGHLGCLW
ncbi:hypothetical protein B0H17DRAFT_1275285 [Mycena rosella]|uniref:Uncharacterized protein n=1 Tax=Mycena rosella TaxID=1033263 RepID=A0AAD7C9E9_MYCRO|nr:hypothetical protein B0H17DRAFT_1275285 [Mycena rosella]